MEQQLKNQRNKLFIKVALILISVWIIVSAVFIAIRLYNEKNNVQKQTLENLSLIMNQLSTETSSYTSINDLFLNNTNLIYSQNKDENLNSQFVLVDPKSKEIAANTANKIGVKFGVKYGRAVFNDFGFIDYYALRNSLTDNQYETIRKQLNTKTDGKKHYELICTKFCYSGIEFIPVELKTVLIEDDSDWYVSDKIIETFTLKNSGLPNREIFSCNDMRRNIIPKSFLLNKKYNPDYISSLAEEQRKSHVAAVSAGIPEYIFYATDYLYVNKNDYYITDKTKSDSYKSNYYLVQYAKKINILDNCKSDIIIDIAIIFTFFLIITLIICIMIWKTIKIQFIQEQRRIDMTNALAHDIKTPLFVISGYAYSLMEDIDSGERDAYLDKIIKQTETINSMVHKMLDLSKLESYKVSINRTEFDLYELTKEIYSNYTFLPDNKKISLIHSGNCSVNADRELIRTAIQNLLDNAVKYSLKDSEIQIEITNGILKISNKSEPFTKSEIKQLFNPYYRKDKSRHKNGNGLGLSIVKKILDLHNAKYDIKMNDSTLIFTIQL